MNSRQTLSNQRLAHINSLNTAPIVNKLDRLELLQIRQLATADNGTVLNTNHLGTGSKFFATCDANGRAYIHSDIGIPINALLDSGGQQSLRCENGRLRVDTHGAFGSVVDIKDNSSISGAYQFNSVLGDLKKRDKITLEIRSNTAATGWTCELGFSMDGLIWTDTITNINAVPAIQQIVQVDVIAPYWRFVFINTGVASNWTIKYIIS